MPFEFQTSHGMVTPHKKVRIQNMFKHPKCLFKHLRKLDGNMGTVNKSLKKEQLLHALPEHSLETSFQDQI